MKKRAMKKWIPKNTPYCYTYKHDKEIPCPWRKYIKTIYYNKDERNCPYNDTCESNDKCWIDYRYSCKVRVYRCEYLGYTDYEEDSLLWDACKECKVGDDWDK
jgi:hypothetical protein